MSWDKTWRNEKRKEQTKTRHGDERRRGVDTKWDDKGGWRLHKNTRSDKKNIYIWLYERKWEEALRDKVKGEENRWDKKCTDVCSPLSLLHCYVSQHTETLSHKHDGAEPEPRWSMVWMQWQQKISLPDHIQATVLAVLASASSISIKSNSPLQSPLCDECAGHL